MSGGIAHDNYTVFKGTKPLK